MLVLQPTRLLVYGLLYGCKKKYMTTKETINRRQFFKVATKKVLPIFGAIALVNFPVPLKAANTEPMDCSFGCQGSCDGTCSSCSGSCSNRCAAVCEGSCGEACSRSCDKSCSGSCYGGCQTTCEGSCSGSCDRWLK